MSLTPTRTISIRPVDLSLDEDTALLKTACTHLQSTLGHKGAKLDERVSSMLDYLSACDNDTSKIWVADVEDCGVNDADSPDRVLRSVGCLGRYSRDGKDGGYSDEDHDGRYAVLHALYVDAKAKEWGVDKQLYATAMHPDPTIKSTRTYLDKLSDGLKDLCEEDEFVLEFESGRKEGFLVKRTPLNARRSLARQTLGQALASALASQTNDDSKKLISTTSAFRALPSISGDASFNIRKISAASPPTRSDLRLLRESQIHFLLSQEGVHPDTEFNDDILTCLKLVADGSAEKWTDPGQSDHEKRTLWIAEIDVQDEALVGASTRTESIGCIGMLTQTSQWDDPKTTTEFHALYVRPVHQQRGVAAALGTRALSEAAVGELRACVAENNPLFERLFELYQTGGMVPDSSQPYTDHLGLTGEGYRVRNLVGVKRAATSASADAVPQTEEHRATGVLAEDGRRV